MEFDTEEEDVQQKGTKRKPRRGQSVDGKKTTMNLGNISAIQNVSLAEPIINLNFVKNKKAIEDPGMIYGNVKR